MTTRAQLTQAHTLSLELDHVSTALALLQRGVAVTARLELSIPESADFQMTIAPSSAALQSLLTARQTALQNALANLGITG